MRIIKEKTKEELVYNRNQLKYIFLLLGGVISLIVLVIAAITIGNYETSFNDVLQALVSPEANRQVYNIIVYSRMPRLIASLIVGAALATAGLVYQEIFKNPMASPDVLGVSQGSSVGAAIAIILGCSVWGISVISFCLGVITVILTIIFSKLFGGSEISKSISLILSGIVIGGFMSSALGFLKYISNDTQLSSITFWLMGGFYNVTYEQLAIVLPIVLICIIGLFLLRWNIAMLKRDDKDVKTHGINSFLVKLVVIILSTIVTALSVAISGTIGWIGLAIPNLIRIIVKNNSKQVMALTIVYGMVFTGICDLLARTLTPFEIPVGIITGCLGAIIFVVALIIRRITHAKTTDSSK